MNRTLPSSLRASVTALVAIASVGLSACEEEAPTSADFTLLPSEPVTVEIEVPWDDFGSDLVVQGGYGDAGHAGEALVARAFEGTLNAHTLVRFGAYPASASVRDTTGTLRTDTNLSFVGGYLVAIIDTIASISTGPVTFAAGALQSEWHSSATWTLAVDSVSDQRSWPEAGAGPVTPLATSVWDPSQTDSVQLFLDSTQVAAWSDASNAARGARIELLTDGHRLRLASVALRLNARPSLNPDTVLVLTAAPDAGTFVYDPAPSPPVNELRVGGVPAWRSVLDVTVPGTLTGPPSLCDAVGCPFALGPSHVSYAGLVLRTRMTEAAFQPMDSIALEARPVFDKATLPKSPLGNSLVSDASGLRLGPALFGALEGSVVEIPITTFVKASLSGPDPSGHEPPGTLALLSVPEPWTFPFASFFGPGGPNEPVLKLIVTVSPPVELQ